MKEILADNYVITPQKPTIISALDAIHKADSDDLRLIQDCFMLNGLGVNFNISIVKQKFETIDPAVKLVSKGCYVAKIDLQHVYRSFPVHPSIMLWV